MNNLLVAGTMDVPAGWDFRFGDFLTDLFFQDGLAESTLQVLQVQLRAFNNWLLEATGRSWDHASVDDLQVFLLSWRGIRSVSALRLKQWMLQRLYAWAKDTGIVDLGIQRALLPLRGGLRRPKVPPSSGDIAQLMELPDTTTAKGMRDRAVLELLYGSGLRAAELLNLTLDQVPSRGKPMQIWGKGCKERLVVVGEHAYYWIAQYKAARQLILRAGGHGNRSTAKLFVSSGRYPDYRYYQLRRMVSRYGRECGLQLTPHTLRHAFASHLYQGRASLHTIQLLLGHERLETTAHYVSLFHKDIHAMVEHHHPRSSSYKRYVRW
ncbi:tyrosine-type recombinase/integrase [Comamonas thiooxydans]|uniref:tyrosine-type recombinase/integrase n=1 Tax=Comamonas thiooxydans TaxID=363952 RepID=UPI0020CD6D25|nr:tyrosine-type recombinase/integrase [Comamonas thiooxydans]BDR09187.1 tyrosine-type recombinase/integrase [Comamonas thiooxydans]